VKKGENKQDNRLWIDEIASSDNYVITKMTKEY
jgi:hypothetical protein